MLKFLIFIFQYFLKILKIHQWTTFFAIIKTQMTSILNIILLTKLQANRINNIVILLLIILHKKIFFYAVSFLFIWTISSFISICGQKASLIFIRFIVKFTFKYFFVRIIFSITFTITVTSVATVIHLNFLRFLTRTTIRFFLWSFLLFRKDTLFIIK